MVWVWLEEWLPVMEFFPERLASINTTVRTECDKGHAATLDSTNPKLHHSIHTCMLDPNNNQFVQWAIAEIGIFLF